jgi:DNA-binding transcriptional ArsR family regulator
VYKLIPKPKGVELTGKQEPSLISDSLSNYEKINNLLKKNSSGLTVAEISRLLKITRNTVAISLARLEGAKLVKIRRIGMAKLYSLNPEIQIKLEIDEE